MIYLMNRLIGLSIVALLTACTYIEKIPAPEVFSGEGTFLVEYREENTHDFCLNVSEALASEYECEIADISLCNIYTWETYGERKLTHTELINRGFVSLPGQSQPAWNPDGYGCFVRLRMRVVWTGSGGRPVAIVGKPQPQTGEIDFQDVLVPCRLTLSTDDMLFEIAVGQTPMYAYDGERVLKEIVFDCSVEDYDDVTINN